MSDFEQLTIRHLDRYCFHNRKCSVVVWGVSLVSSLDQAINRLQQSVDRLEASIDVSASQNDESGEMQEQVKHLQARCDRLLEVTKQVDEGLDKTIDRLKFILED